jgi:hypothetical protein
MAVRLTAAVPVALVVTRDTLAKPVSMALSRPVNVTDAVPVQELP